jgi:putative intracellular protease/amidase
MKQLILVLLSVIVFASCAEDTSKVLLFIPDGSVDLEFALTKEAGVMKDILEQSGFEVAVATVSGEPIVAGSTNLEPNLKLDDVRVTDYVGFILPCMAVKDTLGTPIEVVAMVKKAAAEDKPVAAQLGSVETLAKAGVLMGKKYAFAELEDFDANMFPEIRDCGGIYNGIGVIQDGNIITSGICPYWARKKELPDGTQELTRTLIKVINARAK